MPNYPCCCGPPPPPPPPTVNISGCGCQGSPLVLNVAAIAVGAGCVGQGWGVCDGPTATFAPFTLTWGVVPAALATAPGGVGMPNNPSSAWVSGPFPYSCGAGTGDQYWMFWCFGSFYKIANFRVESGSAFLYIISNPMIIGAHGNACSPFSFNNQVDSPSCYLTITG